MQAHKLPASRGWAWVKAGFALYGKNPFALAANVMLMLIIVMLVFSVPGVLLGITENSPRSSIVVHTIIVQCMLNFITPPLLVGLYEVCHLIHDGRLVMPAAILGGFSRNLRGLMQLSALMLAYSLFVFAVEQLEGGLVLEMALAVPLFMANWFSPLLTGRLAVPPLKAAFFSLVAVYRNFGAVAVFCVSIFAIIVLLPATVAGPLAVAAPSIATVVMSVLVFALIPAMFSAFYASTRDIFPELWDASDA